METGVSVLIEVVGNDGTIYIGRAVDRHVSIRRINSRIQRLVGATPRCDVDLLRRSARRANPIKLKVTGPAVIWRDAVNVTVYNKRCVYVQVPGKVNLRVYVIIDCNSPANIAVHHELHVCFLCHAGAGIDVGTNGYSTGQRRIDILGSSCLGRSW